MCTYPDVIGYDKHSDQKEQGCQGVISKLKDLTLEECKKKCDDHADCKYFSIDFEHCRTHKTCQLKSSQLRTIYRNKNTGGISQIHSIINLLFLLSSI